MLPRAIIVAVPVLLATVTGCPKGPPEITLLTGRVTIDGKPVTAGIVSVMSEDEVIQANGVVAHDATYRVAGAPTGPVKIAVLTEQFEEGDPVPTADGGFVPGKKNKLYVATPKRYERFETSGIATLIPSGRPTFDIALTSK